MRKEINPGILVATLAAVVVVVGFLAWRTFGVTEGPNDSPEFQKAAKQWGDSFRNAAKQQAQQGQGIAPAVPPAPPK